jgi:hypothetical protein
MLKCSPVEMRKNLDSVESFRLHGIDFVAIPVRDALHKIELIAQGQAVFDEIIKEAK